MSRFPTDVNLAFRRPWLALALRSPLSLADARSALADQLDEESWRLFFKLGAPARTFRGKIKDDHFKIVRQIRYRNPCIPIILGHLREEPSGTVVEIRMRMVLPICLFLGFWMAAAGLAGVAMLALSIIQAQPIGLLAPLPFAVGALFIGFAFGSEAVEAERLLRNIFRTG